MSSEEIEEIKAELEAEWPNLAQTHYRITSKHTNEYNCLAWVVYEQDPPYQKMNTIGQMVSQESKHYRLSLWHIKPVDMRFAAMETLRQDLRKLPYTLRSEVYRVMPLDNYQVVCGLVSLVDTRI
jgi:hypothetical protein